jgi:putative resolvase
MVTLTNVIIRCCTPVVLNDERATERGLEVGQVASARNSRVLSDRSVTVIVVEHRDRLARFGEEHLRDMVEVLTSMCARLYWRRGARNRAVAR